MWIAHKFFAQLHSSRAQNQLKNPAPTPVLRPLPSAQPPQNTNPDSPVGLFLRIACFATNFQATRRLLPATGHLE